AASRAWVISVFNSMVATGNPLANNTKSNRPPCLAEYPTSGTTRNRLSPYRSTHTGLRVSAGGLQQGELPGTGQPQLAPQGFQRAPTQGLISAQLFDHPIQNSALTPLTHHGISTRRHNAGIIIRITILQPPQHIGREQRPLHVIPGCVIRYQPPSST